MHAIELPHCHVGASIATKWRLFAATWLKGYIGIRRHLVTIYTIYSRQFIAFIYIANARVMCKWWAASRVRCFSMLMLILLARRRLPSAG